MARGTPIAYLGFSIPELDPTAVPTRARDGGYTECITFPVLEVIKLILLVVNHVYFAVKSKTSLFV